MDFDSIVRMLELQVTEAQRRACRYLERAGQRFCVDFGIENAMEKARAHWRAKRRKRRP